MHVFSAESISIVVAGYVFSVWIGGQVILLIWRWMWSLVPTPPEGKCLKTPDNLAIIQGSVERALYTSCIVFGEPKGIAVWLGFKALMRVRVEENDERHVPGSAIYMVGTALSLAFGVAGGLMAKWSLEL